MRHPAPSSSKCATTYKAALTWALLGADCNSFRLSIEWSRLYPRQGELNKAAVERYNAIFDTLERCGRSQRPRLFQKAAPDVAGSRSCPPACLGVARYVIRARTTRWLVAVVIIVLSFCH